MSRTGRVARVAVIVFVGGLVVAGVSLVVDVLTSPSCSEGQCEATDGGLGAFYVLFLLGLAAAAAGVLALLAVVVVSVVSSLRRP